MGGPRPVRGHVEALLARASVGAGGGRYRLEWRRVGYPEPLSRSFPTLHDAEGAFHREMGRPSAAPLTRLVLLEEGAGGAWTARSRLAVAPEVRRAQLDEDRPPGAPPAPGPRRGGG